MNLYYQAVDDAMREDEKPRYAFRITKDHISDGPDDELDAVGQQVGDEDLLRMIDEGLGRRFVLYADGDTMGELERYFEGVLVIDASASWDDEEIHSAPLRDFGVGYAGCTVVKWPGHPGWTCS